MRKHVKGRRAVREWVKLRERNEGLNLEAYALAALCILGPAFIRSLAERAVQFARPLAVVEAAKAPSNQLPWVLRRRRRDWGHRVA